MQTCRPSRVGRGSTDPQQEKPRAKVAAGCSIQARYTPSKLFVTEQYDGRSGEHDRLDDGH
jgi:hypothetical protein